MTASFTGRAFGRYRLIDRLGAGAMGEVYRAHDDRLDRDVAIKVIHTGTVADEEARRRLRREADTLSKLNHPNIATVHDVDRDGDVDFVVMELVAGQTLGQRLAAGPLDEREVLRIGTQIADGLASAHEQGVVHRDLKPGNIMLTPKGQVKLLDFGLAQRTPTIEVTAVATISAAGVLAGTFPYMAPEQLRNQAVGPATDVWALGVVLYELSTGRRPFGGSDIASIIDGILNHTPEPPAQIAHSMSLGLGQVIQKALCKSPGERYQSAAEVGAALQALLAGSSTRIATAGRRPAATGDWSPIRIARSAAVAALLMTAIGGAWWWSRRTPPAAATAPAAAAVVLVGGVENRTGDSTFDQMLPELLATSLEQSHAVSVYPQSNLGYVLRRMQRDPATRIDESIGREICQREGLSALVVQSITKLGNSFVLVVRAVMPDGRLIASTQQTLGDLSELPKRMDAVGKALRESFGESAASIAKASVPLADVTSQSLDAVRFYTLGRQRIYAGDARGALVFFQKAVDTDPDFAMAHAGLGTAYTNLFDDVRSEQHFREAASHLSRVPEIEREKVLGDFDMIRRNYDGACKHFQVLVALRPRDAPAFLTLGYCSARGLDPQTALAATTKAYELLPTPRTKLNLAFVNFLIGNAQTAIDLAEAVGKEVPGAAQVGFVIGKAQLAQGHFDAARTVYRGMVAAGGDQEIEGHAGLADVERSVGRLDAARAELDAWLRSAEQRGNVFSATSAAAERAELALIQQSPSRYQESLGRVTTVARDVQLIYRVGRAWARGGRTAQASALLKKLEDETPERSRQFDSLKAMLRAEIALGASNGADAVKEAEAAVAFEDSPVALDTLARAYITANRPADAVRPLEQMLAAPDARCESHDAPACFRIFEAADTLARLKSSSGGRAGAPSR